MNALRTSRRSSASACRAFGFGIAWFIWIILANLTACSPPGSASRSAAPDGAPDLRRIVSLAPSLTGIVQALGAPERLVGVTSFCPDVPAGVTRVGGLRLDLEQIAVLQPDVVLAIATTSQQESLAALRRIGLTVLVLPAETAHDVYDAVGTLSARLGAGALEAARPIQAALAAVIEAPAPPPSAPRAVFVVDRQPPYVAGAGSFVTTLLYAAGYRNAFDDRPESYLAVSLEEIVARDPEFVFDCTLVAGGGLAPWDAVPGWAAAAAGRVHAFPRVVPGVQIPRWVDALSALRSAR